MQDPKAIQADEITVLRASAEHIPAVVRISEEGGLSHWSTDEYLLETRRHDSIFLVSEMTSGDTVGFIVGRIVPSATDQSVVSEIYNIGVGSNFRRSGVGTKLLSRFIQLSNSFGVREVFLEVRSQNTMARNFYVSQGFQPCGERKGFYLHPSDHAIIMKSTL